MCTPPASLIIWSCPTPRRTTILPHMDVHQSAFSTIQTYEWILHFSLVFQQTFWMIVHGSSFPRRIHLTAWTAAERPVKRYCRDVLWVTMQHSQHCKWTTEGSTAQHISARQPPSRVRPQNGKPATSKGSGACPQLVTLPACPP